MTLLDALSDANLLGAAFRTGDWSAWRVALKAMFGLGGMTATELAVFRACTGRSRPAATPARETWFIVGRRGGKSRIAAAVSVFLACFQDYAEALSPGEVGTLHVIASDRRQARVVLGYIRALLDTPLLRQLVVAETQEAIELSTRVRIEVGTASFRSLRGYTCVGAVLDEVAFFRSDDSANPDVEILNALRPATATIPGAMLIGISSPYARRGVLWSAFRKHFGVDGSDVLVWKAPTRTMNPSVPQALIDAALADDEAAARAEWLAEFRSDLEAFVSREVLDACTVLDRHALPPLRGTSYTAFVDPSGGAQDAMTLALAHVETRDGQVVAVLDHLSARTPPFSPEQVVEEFCATLATYGVTRVVGDRYGGEWPREQFRKHGVTYEPSERAKSDLYRELLPLLTSGRVQLLDHRRLQTELLGLERRTARGGRDSIDHGPGGHDDVANAAAGAVVLATAAPTVGMLMLDDNDPAAEARERGDHDLAHIRDALPECFPRRDPDLRCGTCVWFDARAGICRSSGPWRNHIVTAGSPSCEWFDPLPDGEAAMSTTPP